MTQGGQEEHREERGWGLDLSLVGLGSLGLGLTLASLMGVWSPWEAQVAQALEEMSSSQSWLTLRWPSGDGQSFEPVSALPLGWSLSALCYGLLPTELGLRLSHVALMTGGCVAMYSASRRCAELCDVKLSRRVGWIASLLWLATPASLLAGTFALSGLGGLWVALASLWWLTPVALKRVGVWLGVFLCVVATLLAGALGLMISMLTAWGASRLAHHSGSRGALTWAHCRAPVTLALVAVGLMIWRLSIKNELLVEGELSAWLSLWILSVSPFQAFSDVTYAGFQGGTHVLAYALFPVGVLLPSALSELLGEGRPLGKLLTAWFGVGFLALALSSAYSSGAGGLATVIAPPAVIASSLYLMRADRRGSVLLSVTSALFMLLILSDMKHNPALLLSSLVGQEVGGLDARFTAWRPLVTCGYVGLATLILFLSPIRASISGLALRVTQGRVDHRQVERLGRSTLGVWALGMLGGLTWFTVALSDHLSQRDLIDRYQALARPDEPLSLYRMSAREAADSYYLRRLKEAPADALQRASESEERSFFIIKRAELSTLNKAFRRRAGRHLTILDDSSHELLLASNLLRSGERDLNPIGSAVIKELPSDVRTLKEPFVFEDKVELVGWSITPGALKSGSEARLKLYWRALKKMRRSWKVFVHIDASRQRIHADHLPVEGLYPTQDWRVGDLIQDVHPFKVKSSISSNIFKVHAGLYQGSTRLKLTGGAKKRISKDNRALLGRVRVY